MPSNYSLKKNMVLLKNHFNLATLENKIVYILQLLFNIELERTRDIIFLYKSSLHFRVEIRDLNIIKYIIDYIYVQNKK